MQKAGIGSNRGYVFLANSSEVEGLQVKSWLTKVNSAGEEPWTKDFGLEPVNDGTNGGCTKRLNVFWEGEP